VAPVPGVSTLPLPFSPSTPSFLRGRFSISRSRKQIKYKEGLADFKCVIYGHVWSILDLALKTDLGMFAKQAEVHQIQTS
jgi:hypothetical protein